MIEAHLGFLVDLRISRICLRIFFQKLNTNCIKKIRRIKEPRGTLQNYWNNEKWLENLGKTLNMVEKYQTTLGRGTKQQNIQVCTATTVRLLVSLKWRGFPGFPTVTRAVGIGRARLSPFFLIGKWSIVCFRNRVQMWMESNLWSRTEYGILVIHAHNFWELGTIPLIECSLFHVVSESLALISWLWFLVSLRSLAYHFDQKGLMPSLQTLGFTLDFGTMDRWAPIKLQEWIKGIKF